MSPSYQLTFDHEPTQSHDQFISLLKARLYNRKPRIQMYNPMILVLKIIFRINLHEQTPN